MSEQDIVSHSDDTVAELLKDADKVDSTESDTTTAEGESQTAEKTEEEKKPEFDPFENKTEPKKKAVPKNIEKLLKQRNDEREGRLEAEAKLKAYETVEDDYSDYSDKGSFNQQADESGVQDKLTKLELGNYVRDNPGAKSYEDKILSVKKEYPNLTYEAIHRMYANDPAELNKADAGAYNVASEHVNINNSGPKDISQMTDDEFMAHSEKLAKAERDTRGTQISY